MFNLTIENPFGCQSCECDLSGTQTISSTGEPLASICDQSSGQCACLANRLGRRCQTCADGEHLPN